MIPISEKLHVKRLKGKNVTIIEKYLEPGSSKTLIRNVNKNLIEPICGCEKYEKEYYLGEDKIFVEKKFDSDTKYTYFNSVTKNTIECPNCGYIGKTKEFTDGCPYCDTDFYVEFTRSRKYEKNKIWRYTPTGLLFIIVMILTWNLGILPFEVLFWLVLGLILIFIIFGVIFMISNIHSDIKENGVWHEFKTLGMNIDESRVYNNLYTQLCHLYYDKDNEEYKDLIDFDIYKYIKAKYDREGEQHYIILSYNIRKYYLENNKIKKTDNISEVKLLMNNKLKHKKGKLYTTHCKSCGSSISIVDTTCKYCNTENHSVLNWLLDEIVKDPK